MLQQTVPQLFRRAGWVPGQVYPLPGSSHNPAGPSATMMQRWGCAYDDDDIRITPGQTDGSLRAVLIACEMYLALAVLIANTSSDTDSIHTATVMQRHEHSLYLVQTLTILLGSRYLFFEHA